MNTPALRLVVFSMIAPAVCPAPHSWAHGDLHEQIAEIGARIASQPANAALYLQRAELHRVHEDWKAAEADYRKAADIDPQTPAVALGLGKLFLATGRFREARKAVNELLKVQPDHGNALVIRARAHAGLGDHFAAARDFASATTTSQHPEPEWFLEQSQSLVAAGDVSKAVAALDEGIARLGEIPALGVYAVDLEVKQNRYDAALARIDRLSATSKRKERWLERRGDILGKAGRAKEAFAAYQSAQAAIDALPPHLRATKLVADLGKRIKLKARDTGYREQ